MKLVNISCSECKNDSMVYYKSEIKNKLYVQKFTDNSNQTHNHPTFLNITEYQCSKGHVWQELSTECTECTECIKDVL